MSNQKYALSRRTIQVFVIVYVPDPRAFGTVEIQRVRLPRPQVATNASRRYFPKSLMMCCRAGIPFAVSGDQCIQEVIGSVFHFSPLVGADYARTYPDEE